MALCWISSAPSNHYHNSIIIQNLSLTHSSPPPHKPKPPQITTSVSTLSSSNPITESGRFPVVVSKRLVNLTIVGDVLSRFLFFSKALASQLLELQQYTDPKEGFTLLIPSSWIKVEKAGATVLFEDAEKKSNNIGVVVNPTRISSLDEYGTPQFVADKLIQAERRKESTKEAEVIAFSERSGRRDLQVYEFEYKVDSTRGGLKRVFSAAFVASKKLYLLNIAHSDGLDDPLDMERRMTLEQILHSFDAVSAT
ncbi:psbP domain-containing 2, chloroplastic [Olea europaea subsp. europaea]|uniref:PsbP domain-containing 2, chloroplastic n=1 Tax=Olea europaea subsp. europaea TaxID=158383 RepID=A0A8S0QI79_OLEEU|nr:psbP domain-containing 2, chloroplastic [Olea europaea subsp. europaea]